jgi:hypothetical protein
VESGTGKVFVDMTAGGKGGAGFALIETTPSDARIDIDGKSAGLSPLKVPLTAGRHTILISKAGYVDREVSVTVESETTAQVRETLEEKTGSLLIIASPSEAEVFFDGQSVGKVAGPIRIANVVPGIHEIRVEKSGYVAWSRNNVKVTREKTETILVSLHPERNDTNVRIYTDPEGARVWLDGKEVGVAGPDGVGFQTSKGAHVLRFEVNPAIRPGFRPLQVSMSFTEDMVDLQANPVKLPVIDEAFISAQKLFERGEGEQAISFLDRVSPQQASYPESRVMMVEILKELGRTAEIPAEFDKLFTKPVYQKNPVLNLAMGFWAIRASQKTTGSEAAEYLRKGMEALDRCSEMIDYFPAAERHMLALKSHYYLGIAAEMLFDLTGEKKHVKKGVQSWELFFGRLSTGEDTLGGDWIEKAKRHQKNLLFLEKKLGG